MNISGEIPSPMKNKLSKRKFIPSPKYPSVCTPIKNQETENQIVPRFFRKYSTGKFPDVKITQRDVMATIINHTRYNPKFATSVFMDLVSSVKIGPEEKSAIAEACSKVLKRPNDFAPVVIELMYRMGCKEFYADDVVKICKSVSCESLGMFNNLRKSFRKFFF